MFTIQLTSQTQKDIKRLSPEVQKYIFDKIFPLLKTNPKFMAQRLKGELSYLWKYRFSFKSVAYRIVYEIREKELIVLVFAVGTRENFYKDLRRRK